MSFIGPLRTDSLLEELELLGSSVKNELASLDRRLDKSLEAAREVEQAFKKDLEDSIKDVRTQ